MSYRSFSYEFLRCDLDRLSSIDFLLLFGSLQFLCDDFELLNFLHKCSQMIFNKRCWDCWLWRRDSFFLKRRYYCLRYYWLLEYLFRQMFGCFRWFLWDTYPDIDRLVLVRRNSLIACGHLFALRVLRFAIWEHTLPIRINDLRFAHCVVSILGWCFTFLAALSHFRYGTYFVAIAFYWVQDLLVAHEHKTDNSTNVFAVETTYAFVLLLSTEVVTF